MFSTAGYKWIITCDMKPYNIHVWGTIKDGLGSFYESLAGCLFVQTMCAAAAVSPLLLSTELTNTSQSDNKQTSHHGAETSPRPQPTVPNSEVTTPPNTIYICFVLNRFHFRYLAFRHKSKYWSDFSLKPEQKCRLVVVHPLRTTMCVKTFITKHLTLELKG